MKVGPNDPCSCGSGKKYKKCCWVKDQQAQAIAVQQMRSAAAEEQAGAGKEAAGAKAPVPKMPHVNPNPVRSDAPRRRAV